LKEQERRRKFLYRVFAEAPGHEEIPGRFPHPSSSKRNSLIDQEEVWEHTSSQNLHVHGDFRVFAQPTICH